MTNFKLGRKTPLFTPNHMKASFSVNAVLASFGNPPGSSADFVAAVDKHTNGDWGMMLNDTLGDCTCADTGHALMLRTANTGTMVTPTEADILHLYEQFGYVPTNPNNPQTNATDQGAMEGDVCQYMVTTGLCGHKSLGTAPIVTGMMSATAIDHIKWGVQVFGAVRLGANLPASAETQFDAGKPWDVGGDETIVGGHDFPVVKYDPHYAWIVTWGKLQAVTYPWLMKFIEEAHCELFSDFIRSSGTTPAGFKLATMVTDLHALAI